MNKRLYAYFEYSISMYSYMWIKISDFFNRVYECFVISLFIISVHCNVHLHLVLQCTISVYVQTWLCRPLPWVNQQMKRPFYLNERKTFLLCLVYTACRFIDWPNFSVLLEFSCYLFQVCPFVLRMCSWSIKNTKIDKFIFSKIYFYVVKVILCPSLLNFNKNY